tara:strand:- start:5918 stop:6469 length:552 start_codon:yes stop_codon:yes gene_type:complete
MKVIHLLSGGLDSVTMLYELNENHKKIHALLINYNQKHQKELYYAKQHCENLEIDYTEMEIPALNGLTEGKWIVPNRNAIFISLAVNVAAQMGYDTITIGCNADDNESFPDCRAEFIDSMNEAIKSAGYKIIVCAPYLTSKKSEIMKAAKRHGLTKKDIWTCYRGEQKPCGKCPACKKLNAIK